MRLPVFALAAVVATIAPIMATPAMAGEARLEAHVALDWDRGWMKSSAGLGAGYDFDLANTVFIGPEVSIDKLLASNATTILSGGGRAGVVVPKLGRIFVAAGAASRPYTGGASDWYYGVGVQHVIETGAYLKAEYLHYTPSGGGATPTRNALSVSFGATIG